MALLASTGLSGILSHAGASSASAGPCRGPVGPGIAYQTDLGSYEVAAIDTVNNRVSDVLQDPNGPSLALPTPDGRKLYVNDWDNTSIGVVDLCAWRFVKHIPMSATTFSAMSRDGRYFYASAGSTTSVIDTRTDRVVKTFTTGGPVITSKTSPDDRVLWVGQENNVVVGLSTATGKPVTNEIQVTGDPLWLTLSPNGKHIYVGTATDTLDFIDIAPVAGQRYQGTLGNVVLLSQSPYSWCSYVEVTPNGRQLWAAQSDGVVVVVDAKEGGILKRIDLGGGTAYVAQPTLDGKRIFVGSMTDRPSAVLGPASWFMAIAHAYPIAKPGRMTVFDTGSFKEITRFDTGIYPSGVEFPTRTVFRRNR